MAILNHSVLGKISGKLGNLVIYQLNGKTVVREKPRWKKSYQASSLQRLHQKKFRVATDALRPLGKVLDKGYGEWVTSTRKGFHFALSQTLRQAMIEQQEVFMVNFESVLISSGFVAPAKNPNFQVIGDQNLRITWETQGGLDNSKDSDLSWVVVYYPDLGLLDEFDGAAFRKSQVQEIEISQKIDLHESYLFISFYRKQPKLKRQFSNSVCLKIRRE